MTLLEIAMQWTKAGYAVIPILYRNKRPDAWLLPDYEWAIYQKRLPSNTELVKWFPAPLHNIALITGWNNLVVIDFDNMFAFECWYSLFPIDTYMVKTNRGMHVYLRVQQPVTNYHGELLDIKANGGYVLIPPSVHPSGYIYQVYRDQPILEIEQLSSVLPEELMPAPKASTILPIEPIVLEPDPWTAVEKAWQADEDLVSKVREKNLLEFFPDAIQKSGDGRWWIARCPFHSDHNPSFWIDTRRQICGCYVGCTPKPLDVINLFARLHGLTNRDAILIMAKSS